MDTESREHATSLPLPPSPEKPSRLDPRKKTPNDALVSSLSALRGIQFGSLDYSTRSRLVSVLTNSAVGGDSAGGLDGSAEFGSSSSVTDVSTWSVLKAHLKLILLSLVFMVYGWYYMVVHGSGKYLRTYYNVLVFEWSVSRWRNVYMVPYNSLYAFFYLEFVGYTSEEYSKVLGGGSSQRSSDYDGVFAKSIGVILHQSDANTVFPPPPDIPQPFLNGDKKIVVPSKREIQQAIGLRNEYFTKQRIHVAAEEIRLLSELTRFVLWISLLPSSRGNAVDFATVYEACGTLWKGDQGALEKLRDSTLVELNSYNSMGLGYKGSFPKIELVECYSGKRVQVVAGREHQSGLEGQEGDAQIIDTEAPTEGAEAVAAAAAASTAASLYEIDLNTGPIANGSEPTRDVLTIYLSDDRLHEVQVADFSADLQLQRFPPAPELLMVANSPWKYKTFGFLTRFSTSAEDTLLYATKSRFGFKFFLKAMYFYSANTRGSRERVGGNEGSISESMESINSSNFLRLFWSRLGKLRFFDLNSAPEVENEKREGEGEAASEE